MNRSKRFETSAFRRASLAINRPRFSFLSFYLHFPILQVCSPLPPDDSNSAFGSTESFM